MAKTRLSRTAAIVIMTSALAWNLPVLAQDDAEDAVSVTVVGEAAGGDALESGEEALRAESGAARSADG